MEMQQPGSNKHKEKMQWLQDVRHQQIEFNGWTLPDSELQQNPTQPIASLHLTDPCFDSVEMPLVIEKRPHLLSHKLRSGLRGSQARTTQEESMLENKFLIASSQTSLIGTAHQFIVAMAAAISSCLGLQFIPFAKGSVSSLIMERQSISCNRDGNLYSRLHDSPCHATYK